MKVAFYRVAGDAYEFERFRRRRRVTLCDHSAWIAAPDDVLLHILRWHTMSPTDRQLTDARGISLVTKDDLDRDYMDHCAEQIGVFELLKSVLDGCSTYSDRAISLWSASPQAVHSMDSP